MSAHFNSPDGQTPQGVFVLDPVSGLPVAPGGGGSVTVLGEVEIKNDAGSPVPMSAATLPLPTGAATQTTLSALEAKVPAQVIAGLLPVDTLASFGVARQLTAGASSANTALTSSCRRVSMRCRNADVRFAIGTGVQTANASTSHFIGLDERLDFDVPASAQIAVIRAGSSDGIVELSELS